VALVTGAASGIGRAAAEMLRARGAAVAALDINPAVTELFTGADALGIAGDVTDPAALEAAVQATVRQFGGIDIVVSNAGVFSPSEPLERMSEANWQRSLELNLTSAQRLVQLTIPFLRLGFDSTLIINASKNVPAPGPGAGAYSVAKAGLTQLARVAALELAKDGIRVNVLHPHAVFDTAAWTPEVLAARAQHYGMTVDEYRRNNLLRVEVTSQDVAELVCAMAGPAFAKTTGAQVPIDGGSDRVV
jgi:NAD(P)-dependent dehydrogenase (short-subunit alcohol dehydrogenase family)